VELHAELRAQLRAQLTPKLVRKGPREGPELNYIIKLPIYANNLYNLYF